MELEVWSEEVNNFPEQLVEVPINVKTFNRSKVETYSPNEGSDEESSQKNVSRVSFARNFTCDQCGKEFYKRFSLQNHLKTHAVEKDFLCTICNKSFVNSAALRRHETRHTGEKPYRCDECGKTFSIPNNFKKHIRTHTGEKPYICLLCQKCFSSGSNLKAHMKSHVGERPHMCHICNKTFTLKGHLVAHHKIHFPEKTYSCNQCDKFFRLRTSLKKHLKVHANLELCQITPEEVKVEDYMIFLNEGVSSNHKSSFNHIKQESSNDDGIFNACKDNPMIKVTKQVPMDNDPNKEEIKAEDHCQTDGQNIDTIKEESTLIYHIKGISSDQIIDDNDADICDQPEISIFKSEDFQNEMINIKSTLQASPIDEQKSIEKPKIRVFFANNPKLMGQNILNKNSSNNCVSSQKSYSPNMKSILIQSRNIDGDDPMQFKCETSQSHVAYFPMEMQYRRRKYECSACDRRFNTYAMFKEHLKFHDATSQFTCRLCATTFGESSSLSRHMKKHLA